MDRQKKLECCEEVRAPPGKPKSKHINWERVFGNVEVPKALSEFYSAIIKFPNTVQGQTLRQAEDEKRKWWVDLWHTRVANTPVFQCDVELLTKSIKKLRRHKSSPDGVTAEIFHQLSSTQLEQLAQANTDMFTSLDFETQWTIVAASLIPKKAFPSKLSEFRPDLFPVDDEETARLLLAGSYWKHTVQFVPNGLSSQDRRFARSLCLGNTKRDGKGVENQSVLGTADPTVAQR